MVTRKKEKQVYVKPLPETLVIIPVSGIHINDLQQKVLSARFNVLFLTETHIHINVPRGKETIWMKRVEKFPFVLRVQRAFHWDPPN